LKKDKRQADKSEEVKEESPSRTCGIFNITLERDLSKESRNVYASQGQTFDKTYNT
jgi:hypothetical protein